MESEPAGEGDADPVDQFEQAYRAATSDTAAPTDLDARLAGLPDDVPQPRRRRRRNQVVERDDAGEATADLGEVLDAIARLEARLDQLEASLTQASPVNLVRTSHQSLGRKLDGHAEDVLAALDRIERRLDEHGGQ